jgi:hypothetical protein
MLVAAVLVCTLLSGIIPFDSASSEHLCTMECCIGKPPHLAGSCNLSFSRGKRLKPEMSCGIGGMSEAPASHDAMGAMRMDASPADGVTVVASDHSDTDAHSADATPSSQDDPSPSINAIAQSLSKPCPPECGSGAVSFAQVRPKDDTATLAYAVKPRPPTLIKRLRSSYGALFITSAHRKQSRPRGPPVFFS